MVEKRRPLRLLIAIAVVALLIYFGYVLINQALVLNHQQEQIQALQDDNYALEEQTRTLQENMSDRTSEEAVEQYMRSHFGMVRADEIRIDIIEQ